MDSDWTSWDSWCTQDLPPHGANSASEIVIYSILIDDGPSRPKHKVEDILSKRRSLGNRCVWMKGKWEGEGERKRGCRRGLVEEEIEEVKVEILKGKKGKEGRRGRWEGW